MAKTSGNWADGVEAKRQANKVNMRKMGKYLQGEPGETLDCIIAGKEPEDGVTAKGQDVLNIEVLRVDTKRIQIMSIYYISDKLIGQFLEISKKHGYKIEGVKLKVTFAENRYKDNEGVEVINSRMSNIVEAPNK